MKHLKTISDLQKEKTRLINIGASLSNIDAINYKVAIEIEKYKKENGLNPNPPLTPNN